MYEINHQPSCHTLGERKRFMSDLNGQRPALFTTIAGAQGTAYTHAMPRAFCLLAARCPSSARPPPGQSHGPWEDQACNWKTCRHTEKGRLHPRKVNNLAGNLAETPPFLTADDRAGLPASDRAAQQAVRLHEERAHRGPRDSRDIHRAHYVELHDRLVLLHVPVSRRKIVREAVGNGFEVEKAGCSERDGGRDGDLFKAVECIGINTASFFHPMISPRRQPTRPIAPTPQQQNTTQQSKVSHMAISPVEG